MVPERLSADEMLKRAGNGASKREIKRWYQDAQVSELRTLEHWIHGYLIRFSHPRPSTAEQGQEFQRLVESWKGQAAGRQYSIERLEVLA